MSKTAQKIKVGDAVEFRTDRQTEKGPSSGSVAERSGDLVSIKHGDHPGEIFKVSELNVLTLSTFGHSKRPLWILE